MRQLNPNKVVPSALPAVEMSASGSEAVDFFQTRLPVNNFVNFDRSSSNNSRSSNDNNTNNKEISQDKNNELKVENSASNKSKDNEIKLVAVSKLPPLTNQGGRIKKRSLDEVEGRQSEQTFHQIQASAQLFENEPLSGIGSMNNAPLIRSKLESVGGFLANGNEGAILESRKATPAGHEKIPVTAGDGSRDMKGASPLQLNFMNKHYRLVTKFVNKIKLFSPTLQFANSTKQQLSKINDPTFYWDVLFRQGLFHKEDSLVNRVWDTIQFITLLMNMIFLPILLAFHEFSYSGSVFIFCEFLPNLIQFVNMFMEFNTGFYDHGVVITSRRAIFLNYVKGKFIFDFLLNICWLISLLDNVSSWFKVIGLLRMIVLVYLLGEIEETFSLRENLGSYFELLKLSGFIFISAHFCGCLWYALGSYEKEIGVKNTWLDRDQDYFSSEENLSPTLYAYIAAFYWSIVTMCTVGYGDIGPTTYRERIFVIFIVLASSFVFGFSMNQIGQIIQNLRSKEEEMKNTIAVLNVYMKKRKLNKEMQLKVRRYYEYIFMHKNEDNEKGRQLIDELTPFLREEVNRDIYTSMFKDQKIFSMNFSESFLTKLYRIVHERQCKTEEYLFHKGDYSQKLFFILKGQINLQIGSQVISVIEQGQFVGSIEFFTNRLHEFSAKTSQLTQIAVIDRAEFLELVNSRREDFESFMQIKDKLLNYQDSTCIGHACESCGKHGHIFDNCTSIKFHANKHKKIYEFTSLKQITRSKWSRRNSETSFYTERPLIIQSLLKYRRTEEMECLSEKEEKEIEKQQQAAAALQEAGESFSDLSTLQLETQPSNPRLLKKLCGIYKTSPRRPLKKIKSVMEGDNTKEDFVLESNENNKNENNNNNNKKENVNSSNDITESAPKSTSSINRSRNQNNNNNNNNNNNKRNSPQLLNEEQASPTIPLKLSVNSNMFNWDSEGLFLPGGVVSTSTRGLQFASKNLINSTSERHNQTDPYSMNNDFEQMHEYVKYFHENNFSLVINRINKIAQKSALYQKMLKKEKDKVEKTKLNTPFRIQRTLKQQKLDEDSNLLVKTQKLQAMKENNNCEQSINAFLQ